MPRTKTTGLYASGISNPFKGDSDGGLAISEGEDYVADQVAAAVNANASDNPFQELGTSEFAVFQNPEDPSWRRVVQTRITRQMKTLEENNLAKLIRVRFLKPTNESEVTISVEYLNIETNNQRESTFAFTSENDVALRPV